MSQQVMYPRVYLAIDNCFASKRWTLPSEWMSIARSAGLACVEASADTECDPLYMDSDYLTDWAEAVKAASVRQGVRVVNLYSGHGSYATLGLAHTDSRVRSRILHDWLHPMVRMAERVGAGLGFFCHAFAESILQDKAAYHRATSDLYDNLANVAAFAVERGVGPVGVEQMYSPHQIPWTIEGAKQLLREVWKRGGHPFYLTLDTGHQTSQAKFLRPSRAEIEAAITDRRKGRSFAESWLGPQGSYEIAEDAICGGESITDAADRIEAAMDAHPWFFSQPEDGDPYRWIANLGGYSPIIHLQQTTAGKSAHLPFTDAVNQIGIIAAETTLRALKAAYEREVEDGMPPRCEILYLTLEPFFGTAEWTANILRDIHASVAYWRQWIPEDGRRLDELI